MINPIKNMFIGVLVQKILQHMKDHPDKWEFSYSEASCSELGIRFSTSKLICGYIEEKYHSGRIHLNPIESLVLVRQAKKFYSMIWYEAQDRKESESTRRVLLALEDIKRKSANEEK